MIGELTRDNQETLNEMISEECLAEILSHIAKRISEGVREDSEHDPETRDYVKTVLETADKLHYIAQEIEYDI